MIKLAIISNFFFFASCATPKLKEWSGDTMTLCCPEYSCPKETWLKKTSEFCKGTATQIGAKNEERVSSYVRTDETQITAKEKIEVNTETTECRIYRCDGQIVQ